jgi:hypothetical protein
VIEIEHLLQLIVHPNVHSTTATATLRFVVVLRTLRLSGRRRCRVGRAVGRSASW